MEQIFISYSRRDIYKVKTIKEEIEHQTNAKCWIDLEGVESGTPRFTKDIISAINSCPIFLFMLSEESQKSENALKELDFAYKKHKEEGKHVVIIYVEKCKMNDIFSFDYAKADTIDWANQDQKKKLIRNINKWTSSVGDSSFLLYRGQPFGQTLNGGNYTNNPNSNNNFIQNNKKYIWWIALAIIIITTFFLWPKRKGTYIDNNLKNAEDSLAYACGMAQSRGLIEYLDTARKVNLTYLKEFKEGLFFGTGQNTNKYPKYEQERQRAFNEGIQIGNQIRYGMVPSINKDVYITDSTKSISIPHLMAGFIDGMDQNFEIMNRDKAQEVYIRLIANIRTSLLKNKYADNKRAGEEFLKENKKKDGVVVLSSGVQYKIIKQGSGKKPTVNSRVTVKYEGRLIDGTIFDSNFEGEPTTFSCNQVIPGFSEILTHMPVGSTWEVYIPQELAYGESDMGTIKPFSMLIFEIHLISIK